MRSRKEDGLNASQLRRRSGDIDRESIRPAPEMMAALSPEAAWKLLHELRVHQLELEMQNEVLRQAQEELHFDLAYRKENEGNGMANGRWNGERRYE